MMVQIVTMSQYIITRSAIECEVKAERTTSQSVHTQLITADVAAPAFSLTKRRSDSWRLRCFSFQLVHHEYSGCCNRRQLSILLSPISTAMPKA